MRSVYLVFLWCSINLFGFSLEDGLLSGATWEFNPSKDKVQVIFYVDPDEKNLNDEFSKALKAFTLSKNKFEILVIVNITATWVPTFLIEKALEKEQRKNPNVTFIVDRKKRFLKELALKDEHSYVLVFDKNGELIYKHQGKLLGEDIDEALVVIAKLNG